MKQTWLKATTAALFALAIATPGLILLSGLGTADDLGEQRVLAPLPAFPRALQDWLAFPAEFESYYDDHFGLRAPLVRAYTRLSHRLRSASEGKAVYGRDGWLFLRGAAETGLDPMTEAELETFRRGLEARRNWLEERGIAFLFVVAPSKYSIYPEKLDGASGTAAPERTRLDQIAHWLEKHSSIEIVDLRDELLAAKDEHQIYLTTDTHWNERGAAIAGHRIASELAKRFPQLRPMPDSSFNERTETTEGGDLARLLALEKELPEERIHLEPPTKWRARPAAFPDDALSDFMFPGRPPLAMETGDRSLPSAVFFHDSFGKALIPFLSEYFERIAAVWDPKLDTRLVAEERPDVVIFLQVERTLRSPLDVTGLDDFRSREQFPSARSVFEPDLEALAGALETNRDVAWNTDEPSRFDVSGDDPRLQLPQLVLEPGARYVVRIELESPAEGRLRLYWGAEGRPFDKEHSLRRILREGANELYLELRADDFDGRLALSPGTAPGAYRLRSLAVREVGERGGSWLPGLN